MSMPLVVMAAGGTGGHVFPAEALAEELIGRGDAKVVAVHPSAQERAHEEEAHEGCTRKLH